MHNYSYFFIDLDCKYQSSRSMVDIFDPLGTSVLNVRK